MTHELPALHVNSNQATDQAYVARLSDVPETIPFRGQNACLLKEDHLAVLYAPEEALLNQACSFPPAWNGLGVDQNKQEQVAPILRLLNALASEYNTHIMVIHHTNKGGDINGTMAFRNHVDTMIELVKEDAADRDSPILFRCMKARDSEPFRDIRTELKSVVLYTNPETMETVTSCVVTTSITPEKPPRDGLKDVEQNILDILGERQLAYTEWQNESTKELSISTATFSRARTTLENKGMVGKVKKEGKRFEVYRQTVKESSAWNE